MEDFKGDVQTGCKTMPIVWGIITSKVVTFFTLIITIGLLMISALKFYNEKEYTAVYYICFALIIPLLILIFAIIRANNSKQFKNASLLLKFIMLLGIAFMFIINRMYE
jgi:4-hydroxybenzoate polyprenyltransferase